MANNKNYIFLIMKLFLIMGNQLFNPKYLQDYSDHTFYMAEDNGLCTFEKHHKLKILHVLSAMRSYRDELTKLGLKVNYLKIEENSFYDEYFYKLKKFIDNNKIGFVEDTKSGSWIIFEGDWNQSQFVDIWLKDNKKELFCRQRNTRII